MRNDEPSQGDLADQETLLVARAKRGDLEAFEVLYRSHLHRVYGVCRRLLDTDQDAEDMTQRVFVKAWERLGSFRGASRWSTWLHRIAVNQVVSERRTRWFRDVEPLTDDGAGGLADGAAEIRTTEAPRVVRLDLEGAIVEIVDLVEAIGPEQTIEVGGFDIGAVIPVESNFGFGCQRRAVRVIAS